MKKRSQDTVLFDKDFITYKIPITDKDKTTNVNILLNRVRVNEKNKRKENLIILFSVIFLISVTGFFTIL